MNLEEAAAKFREAATRAEASLALEVVTEMTRDYITVLRAVTPKRTGYLADSEYPDFITGNGVFATARAGPHAIYARFRNEGGTIHVRRAKVLTDGASFFGRSVTQQGSRYMERGEAAAEGVCHTAAQAVADRFTAGL